MKEFLKQLLAKTPPVVVEPMTPPDTRIYCIGDIHGRLDLLLKLHQLIQQDADSYKGEKSIVYLGDYIDRGAQSKEVVDYLLSEPMPGFSVSLLLGNHEKVLLDFLEHPRAVRSWLGFGGVETLRSYGVGIHPEDPRQGIEDIRDELVNCLPDTHLEFYRSLLMLHQSGSYCFVHAGIRPGIPLQEQRNDDLLWIREEFTRSDAPHENIIVHGHSISKDIEFLPNRIGVDTGAFATGVLSCVVLEGEVQRALQTGSSQTGTTGS